MSNISILLRRLNLLTPRWLSLIFAIALIIIFSIDHTLGSFVFNFWAQTGYFLMGIVGAVFANSTGAGGGVVFIPVFTSLNFSEAQAISTSFGIQCFGMTAGALTWGIYYTRVKAHNAEMWQSFGPVIVVGSLFSILGIWCNYGLQFKSPASLHEIFSVFSILLGLSILITVFLLASSPYRNRLAKLDIIALASICFGGGIITAWLSVGVGEFVAFYLMFRRFDARMSIAAAVVISAITVWSATPYHFYLGNSVNWQVLAAAGPGAIIGGIAARSLVEQLSARRLKLFFALWLLIIGFAS